MKVAIPVTSPTPRTDMSATFGRTDHFLVYDSLDGAVEFIANTAAASPGGTGVAAAQVLVDAGVAAVLTARCGDRATAVLHAAGIDVYHVKRTTASAALASWVGGGASTLRSAAESVPDGLRPGGVS